CRRCILSEVRRNQEPDGQPDRRFRAERKDGQYQEDTQRHLPRLGRTRYPIQVMFRVLTIILLLCPISIVAKTIVVDPAGTIRTFAAALDVASDGDTIRVRSGVYREGNIIITKRITIIGEGYPVFDGEKK